jgi:hypothetical protein
MNKNIKKIIAIALAIGAFSAAGPIKYTSLFTTEAYASSSSADELTSFELETSGGDSLDLYEDSSYDDELSDDLTVGETYYAKTSASKVVINSIDGADDDNVRIFKSGSSTAYEVGDDISISEGTTTTLKVRVYEDSYDADEDYSSSDYNQYTIVVKNTANDNVDLLGIRLSSGYINFNPSTNSYSVNVPSDATSIIVQAIPKGTDYTVKIDGTTVDYNDYYEKTVSLDSDADTITIIVSNDNDTKTYTLNISKTSTTTTGQQGAVVGMPNQLGNQNGNKFGNGNQGFNSGNMNNNGIGNAYGHQKQGWQQISGLWYYYDNLGQMKTGWFQDQDGNWYYLMSSGVMATSTVIDGYKVGGNGAWVK